MRAIMLILLLILFLNGFAAAQTITAENPFLRIRVEGGWLRELQVDPSGKGKYLPSRFLGLAAGDEATLSIPSTGEGRVQTNRLVWRGATLLVPRKTLATAERKEALRLQPGRTLAQEFELDEPG